ncbi:hypothetical protein HPB50_022192 [Hyalomma asiaticum]|uniref:Uncharacterized protein n=1 Tax=Hyalomma asiaticum TaxID=266040 RepID=A0ACB7RPZ7_HYAAI|nr:hypothetical protein HPB50_022192 [Hyalomma asiaticum]
MSESDLDALCAVLAEMSLEVVQSLNYTDLWWLPPMASMTREQAVDSIRATLEDIAIFSDRVFCIAWIYCWLSERGVITTWRPYRLGETGAVWTTDNFILHWRLALALDYPGGHIRYTKVESAGSIYACIMATDPGPRTAGHDVFCLLLHRWQPRERRLFGGNRCRIRQWYENLHGTCISCKTSPAIIKLVSGTADQRNPGAISLNLARSIPRKELSSVMKRERTNEVKDSRDNGVSTPHCYGENLEPGYHPEHPGLKHIR